MSQVPAPSNALSLTPDEELQVITSLEAVGQAIAAYWDTLRELELKYALEIETSNDLFNSLAGDCASPVEETQWTAGATLRQFYADVKVTRA